VVTYRILNATAGGNITFVGNTSTFVAPRLDEEKIAPRSSGGPCPGAVLPGAAADPVGGHQGTAYGASLMPLLAKRITLHYVIQQGRGPTRTRPASPSPVTTPKPSP